MHSAADTPERAGDPAHRRRKVAAYACAAIGVVTAILLAWALYWPTKECDDPNCARQRYSVALEIDALGKVAPIDLEVAEGGEPISLAAILRGGGIELTPHIDEIELPYDPTSGPLDRADLFQLVTAWRNRASQGVDATLYALFVNSLMADNGDELFGIMFDTSGREGFAVAPRTTERFFREHEPALISVLQLRTFTHELLHALNRHHADAAQMHDGRLTLEAPTRCISEQQQRGWRLNERPLMALSPQTIRFFQTAASREVLPGPYNSPFTNRRASATECEDARAQAIRPQRDSRWSVALHRLRSLLWFTAAEAAESAQGSPQAAIRLQAQPAPYPLGYPVAIRVMVDNTGDETLPIVGRLNPRYGLLTIESREAGSEDWRALQPITWFEPTNDENALLQPGQRTEETVPIYYGDDGWTFSTPGKYQVRARMQVGAATEDVVSEPLDIAVVAPGTPDDREALQPLLDADGRLDRQVGRLLYFGGRIGDRDDLEPLEIVAEKSGHTAVGAAMRLTLLSQRLRRPIDPATGLRPPPDFEDAHELLEDTCTDSGVAAMTSSVLEQRGTSLPTAIQTRSETDAGAWDGVTADRGTIPTYSDPTLHRRGPSLHFCFNEDGLRGAVRNEVSQLARQLRRERPARIVLIGHSDSLGTCSYNDSLALRRARAVQRTLVSAGLGRTRIDVVSVGERRPMSFSAAEDAQQMNRRVEILVEGDSEPEPAGSIVPKCPVASTRGSTATNQVAADPTQ
ncbi:MAG: OmpA family protein [Pseudomonadota bacterium]|nr:OmpA family protein [Pseudomonadota bacterium]